MKQMQTNIQTEKLFIWIEADVRLNRNVYRMKLLSSQH